MLIVFATLASAVGAAEFTLRWADNSKNETGFKVERATGSNGTFAQVATTGANVTSYVDRSLAAATLYRYRVRAYNGAGHSSYSNIASGTTPAAGANSAPTLSTIANRTIAEDGTTGAVAFTVGDAQTSAGSLTLSATSSNTTLLPVSRITFGGSGANRTLTARPAANASGSTVVTVTVSDGSLTTRRSFTLTVTAVNDTPTVSSIADRTVPRSGSTGPISFTVGDAETQASQLRVSASSSNQSLIPNSRIVLGGSSANRTISVTPQTGATGTATVTVSVSDGAASIAERFVVSVGGSTTQTTGTNTAPTVTAIPTQNISANSSTGALAFTIGDAQTSAGNLVLKQGSTNQALVPLGNIVFGGSGTNRTVTVTPVQNTTGWSTIYVKVSDGSLTRTISFVVNVSVGLTFGDIGTPSTAGTQKTTGSSIEIQAAGTGIGGTRDQFRYGRTYVHGDSELTVRVGSLTNTHTSAKAGLMFRGSLAVNAPFVFVSVSAGGNVSLQVRATAGGTAAVRRTQSGKPPEWLKLTRVGNAFHAFQSEDGKSWRWIESVTVTLPATTWAGLAVTSHVPSTRTRAVFDGLSLD